MKKLAYILLLVCAVRADAHKRDIYPVVNRRFFKPGVAGIEHDLLSATHADTTTDSPTRGSLIYGNSTPLWDELAISTAIGATLTKVLGTDGTDSGFRTMANFADDLEVLIDHGNLLGLSGDDHTQYLLSDGTRDLTGDWTIGANSVTLTAGTLTAEQLTSTDDLDVTGTGTFGTVTDGTASLTNGAWTLASYNGLTVTTIASQVTFGLPTSGNLIYANAAPAVWSITDLAIGGSVLSLSGSLTVEATSVINSDLSTDAAWQTSNTISGSDFIASLGATGTPSHTFSGDLNTGMWSSTADTINFSTAGVERFELDATSADLTVALNVPTAVINAATGTLDFSGVTSNSITSSGTGIINIDDYTRWDVTDDTYGRCLTVNPTLDASSGVSKYVLDIEPKISTYGTKSISGLLFSVKPQANTGTQTGVVYGAQGQIYAAYNGDVTTAKGYQGKIRLHNSTATITNAYAFYGYNLIDDTYTGELTNSYDFYGDGTDAEDGTVDKAYNFYGGAHAVDAGSLGTAYGMYLEAQTAGGTNYSIYSVGGDNYFGGDVGIGTSSPDTALQVVGSASFGDDTNDLLISAAGVVTMTGTAKRVLTLRPDLDYSTVTAQGKPTRVTYGAYQGYSMPLYAADEELFFNENVPGRWDGVSDITFHVLVALADEELPAEVGDAGTYQSFRLQASWANSEVGEPILNTTTDPETQTITVENRTAAYDQYDVSFTIDYNVDAGNLILSHDDLAIRLRRVDVVAAEEANCEVIVLDYHLHFNVDKMFKAS